MLVSVVVPTWNSLSDVVRMVESWKSTASDRIRLVVVDDGSTDGTLDFLYGEAGSQGLLLARQNNAGPGSARNLGLLGVETEYVVFADVDDEIDWLALDAVAVQMSRTGHLDVVTTPVEGGASSTVLVSTISPTPLARIRYLHSRWPVWGRVYRTSFLRSLEPLFPATRAAEDIVASVRVAASSSSFGYASTCFYRQKGRSESLTRSKGYARKALPSLQVVAALHISPALKGFALVTSAKYFASRGELRPAAQAMTLAAKSLRYGSVG